VRVINQTSSPGQSVVVPINVDTMGDETGYTFSISFDPAVLQVVDDPNNPNDGVVIGDLGGNVIANINNTNGTIGFSVTSFSGPNGTIASVMNGTLVRITFRVLENAAAGTTPINFTDTPARRRVSGVDPQQPLPQPVYENGMVTVNRPTAAMVSVSGRVLTPTGRGLMNAEVVLTDSSGNERAARTVTSGYFRFEAVEVGQTYVVSVRSKRYRFEPQIVTVNDQLADLNLTAVAARKSEER
jgi:hypothetical protein